MDPNSLQPPILNYQTPGDSAYRTLRTFPSEVEANMARHALEAIGITSQLQGEVRQAGLGEYGAVSNGVDLLVTGADLSAAQKFLDVIDQRRADRQAKIIPIVHCPHCNDSHIRAYHRSSLIIAIVLLLCVPIVLVALDLSITAIFIIAAVVAFFRSLSLHTCLHCGHVWKPQHEEDADDDLDDGDDEDDPDGQDDDEDADAGYDDQDAAP